MSPTDRDRLLEHDYDGIKEDRKSVV